MFRQGQAAPTADPAKPEARWVVGGDRRSPAPNSG